MQQIETARLIAEHGMSMRDTEKLVGRLLRRVPAKKLRKTADRDVLRLQEELAQKLGTKVQIKAGNKGRGSLVIQYTTLDQLDAILARLNR
jgi:ParB family chromosome partitioning protein